jgi:hypothetical protein
MNDSLKLCEYPGDIVRLSCEKCGRAGQYRKQTNRPPIVPRNPPSLVRVLLNNPACRSKVEYPERLSFRARADLPASARCVRSTLPKVELGSLINADSKNTKSAYCFRPKTFLPIQYAPPIRTNAGRPTPAIGPGTAAAAQKINRNQNSDRFRSSSGERSTFVFKRAA